MTIYKSICGIITEYNPFHYGHKHHIEASRQLSNCQVLIAIMSPNIVQRGEFAVIDKYRRVQAALEHGVDLVVELPSIYVLQNADVFSMGAIKLLNQCQITNLVFGSESNDQKYLSELAELSFNLEYIKEELKSGISYPSALGKLTDALYPNDILAVAYLRILKNKYPNIKAQMIQRTNDYLGSELTGKYASATAIRENLDKELSEYTPLAPDLKLFNNDLTNYYDLLRYSLIACPRAQLRDYLLIDEGIENHLIRTAQLTDNYPDFLSLAITKRYTASRIRRSLMNILLKVEKADKKHLEDNSRLRVLGFNAIGKSYLRYLNKKEVEYCVKFKDLDPKQRDLEYKIAQLYSMYYSDKNIVQREISGPINLGG